MQLFVVALDKSKSTLEEKAYSRPQAYAGSLEQSDKRTLDVKVARKRESASTYAGSLWLIVLSHDRR